MGRVSRTCFAIYFCGSLFCCTLVIFPFLVLGIMRCFFNVHWHVYSYTCVKEDYGDVDFSFLVLGIIWRVSTMFVVTCIFIQKNCRVSSSSVYIIKTPLLSWRVGNTCFLGLTQVLGFFNVYCEVYSYTCVKVGYRGVV